VLVPEHHNNYVIASNHQDDPEKNGDDVLALAPHNNYVIASAAWQSRTVQVRHTKFAIASFLAMT
jgi:hypothetical protein